MYVDTSDRRLREAHTSYWLRRQEYLHDVFTKSNVDQISVATNEDYVKKLMTLFAQRCAY